MDLSMETGMKIANSIEASEYHWGRKKVLALITSVEEFFEDFYDKSLKKKHTWKNVADHMQSLGYSCTSVACEKKWRALKGSYAQALQRQLQGDTSSSFKYFDDLHHILGQEVEPEESSDEAGRIEDDIPDAPYSPEPAEHEDLTNDDGYVWGTEETHLLLDYIMESKKSFSSPNVPLITVWEDIASEMSHVGDKVTSEQCQRKWMDLKEGLKVNQAKTEAMGVMPLWPHYARTQEVASAVDVRTILSAPVKKEKRIRVKSEKELKSSSKKRDDRSSKVTKPKVAGKRKTILERVKSMESSLSVKQRLERLEARMEVSRQQREAAKKTNVLLVQVLAELRRINGALKQEESMEGVQGVEAHSSDPLSCNPANQEFIIVEAIADQL